MEQSNLEQQFLEILESQDFTKLQPFRKEAVWKKMTSQEQELLSTLFVAQGELQLKQGDSKVFDSFNMASRISPDNPKILFKQAIVFALNNSSVRCLHASCVAFEKGLALDDKMFEPWYLYGCVLKRIGDLEGDLSYFQDAIVNFGEAEARKHLVNDSQKGELYWQWANCCVSVGQISGEAHDFHIALSKFRQAAEFGLQDADFWRQYGDALAEMAILMGNTELFLEASELFRNAIKLSPDSFYAWLGLACSYQRLLEYYRDGVYFDLANEAFQKAAELDSNSVDVWLNWGILFSDSGKILNDSDYFRHSFDKFARANTCEENYYLVFYRWGEAQMFLGTITERIDLLREAEAKIIKSLEIFSDNADVWQAYGSCLMEIGRYFSDPEFYLQAIEKFQYGLTLDPTHIDLLNGLGLAHYALGEYQDDILNVEKACRYYAKVIDCGAQVHSQFWNDWGVVLMKLAELKDEKNYIISAIEKFERAIGRLDDENSIRDVEWLYNYGCAYDLLGGFTEDVEAYEKAVYILSMAAQLDPSYSDVRYNLALSFSHLGDLTDDVEVLQQSLDHFQLLLEGDNENELGWHDWGMTLIHTGELIYDPSEPEKSQSYYIQAEDKLHHAISLGSTTAIYSLACVYSLMGNYTAAMHFIERAEQANALPSIDEMLNDEWLEGLHETADFRNFITLLRKGS